jgi:phosphatidylglycerophosphate synthase
MGDPTASVGSSPASATEAPGAFLIARHDVVVDPAIYRRLGESALDGALAVAATRDGRSVGPVLASLDLLDALGDELLDVALGRLLDEGRARSLDVGSAWHERVTNPAARRRAFNALFEACRKPVDGVVARHLNRHVSIFISKRIVGTAITPNMMSVFTFVLAIVGALCAARGGYGFTLAGALLFQWNSILDGVDGELARVRFQHSKLGQWLDTVFDDASNLIFYAGLAVGAASLPFGGALVACAVVAIVTSALASAQFYAELVRVGSGDLYAIDWDFDKSPPKGLPGKLLIFFRNVLKKDFAILFFLALAVLGVLPYGLPIIAGAAVGNFIAATLRSWKRRRR